MSILGYRDITAVPIAVQFSSVPTAYPQVKKHSGFTSQRRRNSKYGDVSK